MTTQERIEKLIKDFEEESKLLAKQIENDAEDIQEDGEVLQDNGTLFKVNSGGYHYNFEWKEVSLHIPVPKFSLEEQSIVLTLPDVTMEKKSIKFNVPTTIMVDKEIGTKPEFTCGWKMRKKLILGRWVKTKFWECETKHTPIIITVPEIHQKQVNIISDIPNISFSDKKLIFNTPSITVEMKLIKFNALMITSIDYEEKQNQIEDTAERIEQKHAKLNALADSFHSQLLSLQIQLVNEEFDKIENDIQSQKKPIEEKYNSAIDKCKSVIKDLKNNNAQDALKVEEDKLNNLIAEMNGALAPLKDALTQLLSERNNAIEEINGTV